MRGELSFLFLRPPSAGRSRGLHDVLGTSVAAAARPHDHGQAGHRDPHRERASRRASVLVLHRPSGGAQTDPPGGSPKGVHRGGDPLLPPALRDVGGRRACATACGRAGFLAGWRRRDLRRARATEDLPGQVQCRRVAGRASGRPRHGIAFELHDALRAHRDGRGEGLAPLTTAQPSGRDRRIPDLHSLGVPPRGKRAWKIAGAYGDRRSAHLRGVAALAAQHSAREGLLDHAGAQDRADRPVVRRRRPRRYRAGRAHLSYGRGGDAPGPRAGRAGAPHRTGRSRAGGAGTRSTMWLPRARPSSRSARFAEASRSCTRLRNERALGRAGAAWRPAVDLRHRERRRRWLRSGVVHGMRPAARGWSRGPRPVAGFGVRAARRGSGGSCPGSP